MLIHAVNSVLSLLILIGVGFVLAGAKWFPKDGLDGFSKFALRICIPCYMFYNVIDTCQTPEKLMQLFAALPFPICIILISTLLGIILARLLNINMSRRGVFINAIAFSNTVVIGFPVINALFGDGSAPDGMIYYMANTILFWTIGAYLLRADGAQVSRPFSWKSIKKIFSPPILGFLAGVVCILLHLRPSEFIWTPVEMLKQASTPIAMAFIGGVIRRTDLRHCALSRDLAAILLIRFVVFPVAMALICAALPTTVMRKNVFFVLATMPAMTQLGIMAKESKSDYQFASLIITVTTVLCMISIPIYTALISQLRIFG